MSAGKVDNVNVIADAASIRRLIIRSKDFDVWSLAKRSFENIWNQMCFDSMVFAKFLRSSGSIEIAERNKFQSVDLAVPAENFFEGEF